MRGYMGEKKSPWTLPPGFVADVELGVAAF